MTFSRRKIFSMLAVVPFVGAFISAAVATNADQVFGKKLTAVRELLLPAVRVINGENPDLDLEIIVDRKYEALIVKGYHRNTKQALGFAITKESIVDGHYKSSFRSSMLYLVRMLHQPPETIKRVI